MTKYVPETIEQILKLIEAGNYAIDAAYAAGISENTYYEWLKKPEFRESIKKARAKAIALRVARIGKAGQEGNWQADAWWLERVARKRFGKDSVPDTPPTKVVLGFKPQSKFIEPVDAQVVEPKKLNAAQLHSRKIGEIKGRQAVAAGRPRKKPKLPRKRS